MSSSLAVPGVDVNVQRNDGKTALDIAIENKRKDIIKLLTRRDAKG